MAAADYIEIALRYKGIIIDEIPNLNDNLRNETRRFIWLVDALYDKNCFQTSFPNFLKIINELKKSEKKKKYH